MGATLWFCKRLEVRLSILAASKRHVDVDQGGRTLLPFSALGAGVMKQDLALGKAADGCRVAVAVSNQG